MTEVFDVNAYICVGDDAYDTTTLLLDAIRRNAPVDELLPLLQCGVNLNALSCKTARSMPQTALHAAASNQSIEWVRALLRAGANVHIRDYRERTAMRAMLMSRAVNFDAEIRMMLNRGVRLEDRDVDNIVIPTFAIVHEQKRLWRRQQLRCLAAIVCARANVTDTRKLIMKGSK